MVHGFAYLDKKGKVCVRQQTDLDAKTALALLKLGGIDTSSVKFVKPGEFRRGKINIDTSFTHGVSADGKTGKIDHHGDRSGPDSSATKFVYEKVLLGLGLLEKEAYLDKLVAFVTMIDNKTYKFESSERFRESYRTMVGLQQKVTFEQLLTYCKHDGGFFETLSDEQLADLGLTKAAEDVKKKVEQSLEKMNMIIRQKDMVPSPKYGWIAVDFDQKVDLGVDAARAYGFKTYVSYDEKVNGFAISASQPMDIGFPQGFSMRQVMWMKPRTDPEPLHVSLEEILNALTDGNIQVEDGDLKDYLEEQRKKRAAA